MTLKGRHPLACLNSGTFIQKSLAVLYGRFLYFSSESLISLSLDKNASGGLVFRLEDKKEKERKKFFPLYLGDFIGLTGRITSLMFCPS